MEDRILISADAQKDLQAYIDYEFCMGADAKPYSPEEYKKMKEKQAKAAKTKVTTNYRNVNGRDCKAIGIFPSKLT